MAISPIKSATVAKENVVFLRCIHEQIRTDGLYKRFAPEEYAVSVPLYLNDGRSVQCEYHRHITFPDSYDRLALAGVYIQYVTADLWADTQGRLFTDQKEQQREIVLVRFYNGSYPSPSIEMAYGMAPEARTFQGLTGDALETALKTVDRVLAQMKDLLIWSAISE